MHELWLCNLSQSALSELLVAIRAGGSEDVLREAMALVLQELIELEAAQVIGAGRYERTDERTTHATVRGVGSCRPRPATSSCASRSCGPVERPACECPRLEQQGSLEWTIDVHHGTTQ